MEALRRFITRNATRQGLLGGSRPWLAVGAAVWTARLLSRVLGGTPKTLYTHELSPGETLVVAHDAADVEVRPGGRTGRVKMRG